MKKIILLLIVFICTILSSCKAYKFNYSVPTAYKLDKDLEDAGYLKKNQAFFCFTRNFDDTHIKVIQKDSLLFEGKITTIEGKAKVLIINKDADIKIYIEGVKGYTTIRINDMSGYKYIYIYKNKNRGFVHFFDGTVMFDKNNVFFPVYTEEKYNCKITQIDSTESSYLIKFYKTGLFRKKHEELLISEKRDTLIKKSPKIKVGNVYKMNLSDKYYNETMARLKIDKEDKFYYDEDRKLIWEKETDRKFYTTDNLINLYYNKD